MYFFISYFIHVMHNVFIHKVLTVIFYLSTLETVTCYLMKIVELYNLIISSILLLANNDTSHTILKLTIRFIFYFSTDISLSLSRSSKLVFFLIQLHSIIISKLMDIHWNFHLDWSPDKIWIHRSSIWNNWFETTWICVKNLIKILWIQFIWFKHSLIFFFVIKRFWYTSTSFKCFLQ